MGLKPYLSLDFSQCVSLRFHQGVGNIQVPQEADIGTSGQGT